MLWLLPGFEFVAAATKTAVGNIAESDSLNNNLSSLVSKAGGSMVANIICLLKIDDKSFEMLHLIMY